ncbi:MAG: IclR family transcriptional regulator [Pseudomonadota bacterium]
MPAERPAHLPPRMGRSPANRSLERGLEVLRAFRPGSEALGNGELAERTGLSRATVSRLTQTLVDAGWLQHDAVRRAYRPAAPVLSLAQAVRSGSPWLQAAGPLMQEVAQARRINVGLAVADRDEMVYLESVRYNRRVTLRNVVAGQRVPMELTSLGRAWLAAASPERRAALEALFGERRGAVAWEPLRREIDAAVHDVQRQGYCATSWQPEVVALATPLRVPGQPVHVLNMSVTGPAAAADAAAGLADALLALAARIVAKMQVQE